MSSIQRKSQSLDKGRATAVQLTGDGIGENEDFLNSENHLFINKLNYICKNYDSSFRDVSKNR